MGFVRAVLAKLGGGKMASIVPGEAGAFNAVISAVRSFRHVRRVDIIGYDRSPEIAWARHETCYLLRTYTRLSLSQIARCLGDRDHTTIGHSCQQVASRLQADPAYAEDFSRLIAILEPAMAEDPASSMQLLTRRAIKDPAGMSAADVQTLATALIGISSILCTGEISDAEARAACLFILDKDTLGVERQTPRTEILNA